VSQGPAFLRIHDVAAYLRVSRQRASRLFHEGRLPKPAEVDGVGPLWKQATIERWAERQWWDTRRWRKRPSGEGFAL
jgi:predicted DNA-binding transcriptional regulator AlpA